jgi:hypothetical protein
VKHPLLTKLLIWPLLLALPIGAVYVNSLVASIAFTIAFFVVLSSIIAAITLTGPKRIYWRGFALFAAAYFLLMLLLGNIWVASSTVIDVESQPPKPIILTSYLLAWMHDLLGAEFRTNNGAAVTAIQLLRATRDQPATELGMVDYETLMSTGHSIFTIYCGLLGGWISSCLARATSKSATWA